MVGAFFELILVTPKQIDGIVRLKTHPHNYTSKSDMILNCIAAVCLWIFVKSLPFTTICNVYLESKKEKQSETDRH